MHTVTAHTVTAHTGNVERKYTGPYDFDSGADAHHYARTLQALQPHLRIEVTDTDGNTVELKANGWSRA